MVQVLTNPQDIKKFLKYLVHAQIEAYFERFHEESDMLLAITDTQSQVDKIQSLLLRSSVLSDRRAMAITVHRLPNLVAGEAKFPLFGIFYISVHTKEERAKVMNTILVRAIARILAGN